MNSISPISTSQVRMKLVARSVDHVKLVSADAVSICTFLLLYQKYAKEVKAWAWQVMPSADTSMMEALHSVSMKLCIDMEWLESTIVLGFINGIQYKECLLNRVVSDFLKSVPKIRRKISTWRLSTKSSECSWEWKYWNGAQSIVSRPSWSGIKTFNVTMVSHAYSKRTRTSPLKTSFRLSDHSFYEIGYSETSTTLIII